MRLFKHRPRLSIVVAFYNMPREAKRTLFTLTSRYQRGVQDADYEVLAIDSGSTSPLARDEVAGMQSNFRYHYVQSPDPTPCRAMNAGIERARGRWVACGIDGARMLSPGLLNHMLTALDAFEPAFVYTIGMHLGAQRQDIAVEQGYCQAVEDEMLNNCGWEEDGYRLFDVAAPAGSSAGGFLNPIAESNFFAAPKQALQEAGGFDERFRMPGGGFVNLDIFNRLLGTEDLTPVRLLGEASFHQFHGGVATNVPTRERRIAEYKKEYQQIRGRPFATVEREPLYFGRIPPSARRFLTAAPS